MTYKIIVMLFRPLLQLLFISLCNFYIVSLSNLYFRYENTFSTSIHFSSLKSLFYIIVFIK